MDDFREKRDIESIPDEEVFGKKLKSLPIIKRAPEEVGFSDKISDLLGDEYKQWEIGDCIFLSASTGLGKSYMIQKCLYEYAQKSEAKIALFVNRDALRRQQIEESKEYAIEKNCHSVLLHPFTYQQIEQNGAGAEKAKQYLRQCRYIVCDEAHYFIADALFNPTTQKSFDFITSLYKSATLIFISATLDQVRPLIEKHIMDLYNKEWEEWNDNNRDKCWYHEDGRKRSLSGAAKKYLKNKKAIIEGDVYVPTKPQIREYQFYRNISENLEVWYFKEINELIHTIRDRVYPGKWLIFVSSKKTGKELRDNLKECTNGKKKIVYVDADYDSSSSNDNYQDEARIEMKNIRRSGLFSCDILISTSVLDTGINITDREVKNIVLFSDDEDSFKQLLGRKRFSSENEKLNLFIFCGKLARFKRHTSEYRYFYSELDEHKCIASEDELESMIERLEKSGLKHINLKRLLSFYEKNEGIRKCYELTKEAIRLKYLDSEKMCEELEKDNNFFLEEQLKWIGKEFSEEWMQSSYIGLPQDKIDELADYLMELYNSVYLISQDGLKNIWEKLRYIAEKIDPANYKNKEGSITTINKALKLRRELENFYFKSCGDRIKYYEILYQEECKISVKSEITLQEFEEFIEGKPETEIASVFEYLFHLPMPKVLENSEEKLVIINKKLAESGLKDKHLKTNKRKDGTRILKLVTRNSKDKTQ